MHIRKLITTMISPANISERAPRCLSRRYRATRASRFSWIAINAKFTLITS